MDREKVIRLIEEEISVCESVNQCYRTIDLPALRDILAVLKEQEAVEPSWQNGKMYCGHCGSQFPPRVMMRFCHRCGVPIKLKVNDIVEQEGR